MWGLAALAAAGALFFSAFRSYRRGRPQAAAVAIVAAGLVLRMYAGSDLFLHTWDERYHALVAKHLAVHPLVPTLYDHPLLPYDYRDWRANHVWLHKPPLALWLMAASMRLLGVDEIAMRLPSLLLSALGIFLTWVIGAHLCGRRVGLLAAAFQATNGYLLQLPAGRVAVDHVDNALLFFVELAIFLAVLQARSRRHWWTWLPAIGAATGLAVLSKWLPGLLPIPVWLAMAHAARLEESGSGELPHGGGGGPRRRPGWGREIGGLAVIAATCLVVALPWQLYIRQEFPLEARWEAAYNLHHLRVPIEGLGGSPLYHLLNMPRFFGELIYLPVAWFLLELVRRLRPGRPEQAGSEAGRKPARALLPLAAWLLLPYLAFSFAATKLGGYVMVAAPALFIVEASFWFRLWDRRPSRIGDPAARPRVRALSWRRAVAATLTWAVLILLPLLPLRYTVERLKIRPGYDRNPSWARALRELPARLGPGPVVLFHLDRPLEAMFYTPYTAYGGLPTPLEISRLTGAGYRVVVLDAAAVPPSLSGIPGVELRPEAVPQSPLDDGTGFRLLRVDGSDSPLTGTTEPPP